MSEEPLVLREKVEPEPLGETSSKRIARRAIPVVVTLVVVALFAFFVFG